MSRRGEPLIKPPIIKPTSDLFIASLWSAPEREPLLRSAVNGVMTDIGEPPVVKATVLNPFNIQEFPVDKQIRLDVLVEDELGAMYDLEVQTFPDKDFFDRMMLYWSITYGSQIQRGNKYEVLRPVRSILITEFPVFHELNRLHAVFEVRARENPKVLFSNHFQAHVLRLGDLLRGNISGLDELCLPLQRWIQFFAYGSKWKEKKMSVMLQDTPEVLAAYDEYKRFTADPVMREKIKARERFEIDRRLDRAGARMEGTIEVARNLKQEGLDQAFIAKMTGLPLSEIDRLD